MVNEVSIVVFISLFHSRYVVYFTARQFSYCRNLLSYFLFGRQDNTVYNKIFAQLIFQCIVQILENYANMYLSIMQSGNKVTRANSMAGCSALGHFRTGRPWRWHYLFVRLPSRVLLDNNYSSRSVSFCCKFTRTTATAFYVQFV